MNKTPEERARVLHRKVGYDRRLPDEPNPKVLCACGCGRRFKVYDKSGRPRMYVIGHNNYRGQDVRFKD